MPDFRDLANASRRATSQPITIAIALKIRRLAQGWLVRMTLRERALDDPLNEVPLPLCIRPVNGKLRCAVLTYEATLQFLVFSCSRGVFAQVIPKCQRALLLFSPRLNDVHMMRVWPSDRPMEEGTERIVWVGYVNVPSSAS